MSVRRKREIVDALEHAMQGVKMTGDHHIESRDWKPGLIGSASETSVDPLDDTSVEREVIVRIDDHPPRRHRR